MASNGSLCTSGSVLIGVNAAAMKLCRSVRHCLSGSLSVCVCVLHLVYFGGAVLLKACFLLKLCCTFGKKFPDDSWLQ